MEKKPIRCAVLSIDAFRYRQYNVPTSRQYAIYCVWGEGLKVLIHREATVICRLPYLPKMTLKLSLKMTNRNAKFKNIIRMKTK